MPYCAYFIKSQSSYAVPGCHSEPKVRSRGTLVVTRGMVNVFLARSTQPRVQ